MTSGVAQSIAMGTFRLVLDVIGVVSAVAGLVAPLFPKGSRARSVLGSVGMNVGRAVSIARGEPRAPVSK